MSSESAKLRIAGSTPADDASNVEKVNVPHTQRSSRGMLIRRCRVSKFQLTLESFQIVTTARSPTASLIGLLLCDVNPHQAIVY